MSKHAQFEKFIQKKKPSLIKEQIKQEKKAFKKERAEAIEKRFEEKRRIKYEQDKTGRTASNPAPAPRQPRTAAPENPRTVAPATSRQPRTIATAAAPSNPTDGMPLNKWIAHSGTCSRRDAAELVKKGEVTVNGQVVTEPGTKVSGSDIVKINNKKITPSRHFVYILLNKPKDYITTTDDPQGRKTVLDLIRHATTERVYPIGRLDRNTSGVLLLTNDGELAQLLSHPKNEVRKIYEVKLDKPLTKHDFDEIAKGITLEDGFIAPDAMAYADAKDRTVLGIEIHSGRNRIVRRIFEKMGYDVRGLDRVMYAGLTKKNVQRSKWRLLTESEIRILKHFNKAGK